MLQHILDAVFECDCARRASCTTALHLNQHNALLYLKVDVLDITAVLLDEWTDACLHNFLNQLHGLRIVIVDLEVIVSHLLSEQRLPTRVVLSDHREDLRFDDLPLQVFNLGNRNEVVCKEYASHAIDLEKLSG